MANATLEAAPIPNLDERLYEVVDGEIVELPPRGVYQSWIASKLYFFLQRYLEEQKLGKAGVELLFDFSKTIGKKRRPDLSYVSYDRWPRGVDPPDEEAWEVVPNLAVEVISPTNTVYELQGKISEYFQVGVERVWVVFPAQRQVSVYDSPNSIRIFTANEVLVDEGLFPGFRFALGDLFETR
jgi:Uma2 family endonuclease